MIEIGQAVEADVPELCALLRILFTQEAEMTPDGTKQERALRTILAEPELGRLYVARDADEVIGMVSLLFTISTMEGGRAAWLEDMIVHPARRGRGTGERLLSHALEEARRLGCARVTLLTDGDNTLAHRFYQRAGFERSGMVTFRRAIARG